MSNTAKKTVGWDSEATLSCSNNCPLEAKARQYEHGIKSYR